ncbi:MAG TPA: type II toxin-antitoxin system death-on-curing family toxin [Rhizorhapis sp.]|nr:type II toxin-antitoxin system death-on-curing family toxin [Rhizorhapis sp.]
MKEPVWVEKEALLLLHLKALARFGGAEGLRDEGLLDSALTRPRNAFHKGQKEIAALAASYAFGLVKNHPFVDGNKRAGFMAMGVFLAVNGWALKADSVGAVQAMMALAGGEIGEKEFGLWLKQNIKRG